jgi:uncharacterized membrane protein
MGIYFLEPLALLLLGLLPLFWWASRRLRSVPSRRRWTARVLRSVIVALFVLALAQPQLARRSKELTVFYVLDESDSIPSDQRKLAYSSIQETAKRMKGDDLAGIVAFAADPSIEESPVPDLEFVNGIRSAVSSERTNIAAALRLALAAFPPDTMKRIVLLTDGNENEGAAVDVARLARGNNIPIDVVPLRYQDRQDLQITKLVAPQQSLLESPFDVKVIVEGRNDTRAQLRLFQDGELLADQAVDVYAGKKNVFLLPQRLAKGGFHTYRATIEALDDARPENNTAHAFTYVKSKPRVLYVEGDETGTNYLAAALQAQDIELDRVGSNAIPYSLDELQSYDSLILSNVPASQMSASQMKMIERAVHDLGIGLVMIGGDNAFGAGGYQDTPVEKALPVSMDVKQKKVLPNGALVIVLHTCEIPSGNSWAREISIAALNVLSAQDYFGLLYWGPGSGGVGGMGGWSEHWAWEPPLRKTGDKRAMRQAIRGIAPSDMPTFDPTLEMAYKELRDVKAEAKHIIIISDGDPAPPKQSLANRIRDEGISVSTVAIAPHGGQSVQTMEALAFWGGGTFYYPKSSSQLPRIFIKEASLVRRSLISEKTFVPVSRQYSEILTGLTATPPLHGHVVTTIKDLATDALATDDDDPVLAHWRYGLGKAVAFTSDAKNKWASDWISWNEYAKFWAQAIRWSMRETSSSNYQVQTSIEGGKGTIVIDAMDSQGNFENFLDFQGNVIAPDFESIPLEVRQVAPGRYQATFPATKVGSYMLSLATGKDNNPQLITGGAALSYSPEYQVSRSNDALLQTLAEESGGQIVESPPDYNPFLHNLPTGLKPRNLWPLLAMLGLLLLPIDIFVRRVYVDWGEVREWVAAKVGAVTALRRRRVAEADSHMTALKGAKARAAARDEEPEEAPGLTAADFRERKKTRAAAREALRERIQKETETRPRPGAPGESVLSQPSGTTRPVRHRGKETVAPREDGERRQPAPQRGEGGFTGSLLEAKRRARKKLSDRD